jgi:nucleotide-binding universal stress UspA family protein
MFETIALALDGSAQSEAAVPVALELAKKAGGRVVVLHVDERTAVKGDMPPAHPDESEVLEKVRGHVESIGAEGVEVSLSTDSVALGGPAIRLAAMADEKGAGVIVVGSRGESSLRGMLLGSVAHKLLHVADVPVLVVPVR